MSQKRLSAAYAVSLGAFMFLTGCDEGGYSSVSRAGNFRIDYQKARSALEAGSYSKAVRRYGSLLERSGPAAGRVRLEYAHALLRANQFADAALMARRSAAEQTGLARASALSVQATAEHEIARASMSGGHYDRSVYNQLVTAGAAFDQAFNLHPELKTDGLLAMRRLEIANATSTVKSELGI